MNKEYQNINTAFKIIDKTNKNKKEYPQIPFVIKDDFNDCYLVFYDVNIEKYRQLALTSIDKGKTIIGEYNSLDEMFKDNKEDKIFEVELIIKGEYK